MQDRYAARSKMPYVFSVAFFLEAVSRYHSNLVIASLRGNLPMPRIFPSIGARVIDFQTHFF